MNTAKEQLILDLIECRIRNIRNNSMEESWMAALEQLESLEQQLAQAD